MASTVSAVSFATSPICMVFVARSETWGMLKGYTLECSPESRAFREMSAATGDGTMVINVSVPQIPKQDTLRRIQRIQTFTIVWMTVEAAMSLAAAWMARSPALLAFGGDSAIELFSAIVVFVAVPCTCGAGTIRKTRCADRSKCSCSFLQLM